MVNQSTHFQTLLNAKVGTNPVNRSFREQSKGKKRTMPPSQHQEPNEAVAASQRTTTLHGQSRTAHACPFVEHNHCRTTIILQTTTT